MIWNATINETNDNELELNMHHTIPDGDENFPGSLHVCVQFIVMKHENVFDINYHVTAENDSPLNMTHHLYFNLNGQGNGGVGEHLFKFNSRFFTPNNVDLITTGEILPVHESPFDFSDFRNLGEMLVRFKDEKNIKIGNGYDHNFVLNKTETGSFENAVTVSTLNRDLTMEIVTDQACVQFYTGNFLDGSLTGKEGKVYHHRYGFCLETQDIPNSVNHPHFPSTIYRSDRSYRRRTRHRFT